MLITAIDVYFAHHWKAKTKIHLTKFLNLGVGAWLLTAKLIAGQRQYD